MTAHAGVLRDAAGLARAASQLDLIESDAVDHEVRNLATVGRALVAAAAEREESRGTHHRLDHPEPARELERIVHLGTGDRLRVPASFVRELEH